MFESASNVKPNQGAAVAIGLAKNSLAAYPKDSRAKKILAAINSNNELPPTEQIIAIYAATRSLALPTDEELEKSSPVGSLVLRLIHHCNQAVLAEKIGDELRAWKCVSSAALYAGSSMQVAYKTKQNKDAAKIKNLKNAIAKEMAFNAFAQCTTNFKSDECMAEKFTEQTFNGKKYEFSTIRKWIRAWRKSKKSE